jgi:hypothetical protein
MPAIDQVSYFSDERCRALQIPQPAVCPPNLAAKSASHAAAPALAFAARTATDAIERTAPGETVKGPTLATADASFLNFDDHFEAEFLGRLVECRQY